MELERMLIYLQVLVFIPAALHFHRNNWTGSDTNRDLGTLFGQTA